MRAARTLYLFIAVLGIVAVAGCNAAEPHPANRFLQQLYSKYQDGGTGPDTLHKDAPELFAPELLALIREDQRIADGEIGVLDHDPVCACQDFSALKVTNVTVTAGGAKRAKAIVDFTNAGKNVRVSFSLREDEGRWRIEDIEEPMLPSLKQFLTEGIAKLAPAAR